MNYLSDSTRSLYCKYLIASVGSALVVSIYSLVDTIAVGQSEGPAGAAAMAIITPIYGVQVFLSILIGIGGSVLMSNAKGEGNEEKANAYFTASALLMGLLTGITWVLFALYSGEILSFFGADGETLPVVMRYAKWLIRCWPVFIFSPFISAFIRNDNAPGLAMAAVIAGGCLNIFGDWFFVFPLGMGMEGAAIATVMGTSVQCLMLGSHFFRKGCGLKFVRPFRLGKAVRKIFAIGIGSSLLDLGTVIIAIIINNQIMRYGGATELAVYGVIVTLTSLIQAVYCGVGQAIQPLVSVNYGAGQTGRVREFLKLSLLTSGWMGIVFTLTAEAFPIPIIRLFMNATPEVLAAAPEIMRCYAALYLFLGITVLATYYLQSVMRDKASVLVSVLRSLVISGALLYALPLVLGIRGVWLAMPVSEFLVMVLALALIARRDRAGA